MSAIVERYLKLNNDFTSKGYSNRKGHPASASDILNIEKDSDYGFEIGGKRGVGGAGLKSYGATVDLNKKSESVLSKVWFKADRGAVPVLEAIFDVADTLKKRGYEVAVDILKNPYGTNLPRVTGGRKTSSRCLFIRM